MYFNHFLVTVNYLKQLKYWPGPLAQSESFGFINFCLIGTAFDSHTCQDFFKHDKINLHFMLDFESLKYLALSTCNLLKSRKLLLNKKNPLSTVNVRIPDVRFGKPDENMSGYRIIRISDVRFITKRPVQNPTKLDRFIYKGGHKNYFLLYKTT